MKHTHRRIALHSLVYLLVLSCTHSAVALEPAHSGADNTYTKFVIPIGLYPVADGPSTKTVLCGTETLRLNKTPIIDQKTMTHITHDTTQIPQETVKYTLGIFFSDIGAKKLYQATKSRVGKKVAFLIGNRCLWAAQIFEPISHGQLRLPHFPLSNEELTKLIQPQ